MVPHDSILANISDNYIHIYFSYLLFRLLQVMVDLFLCSSFDIDYSFKNPQEGANWWMMIGEGVSD